MQLNIRRPQDGIEKANSKCFSCRLSVCGKIGSADFRTNSRRRKMKKIDLKKPYTYYFADGTKFTATIENVGEKWLAILNLMKYDDRRANYNYNRHNYPLSAMDFEGDTFIDENADPHESYICKVEQETIDAAVSTLSKRQQEVFELYYYDKKTQVEIAAELGITQQAVAAVYERAEKNLQRIFGEPVVI